MNEHEAFAQTTVYRNKANGAYRFRVTVGDKTLEPPIEFSTLVGMHAFIADVIAEELHTRKTQPNLEPVSV